MSYSIAKATVIAEQLRRLSTQHAHQLAGHVSNLAFWMAEAQAAVVVIQDYPARFRRLRDAQVAWVRSRDTKVPFYCPLCEGECEFSPATPQGPHRIPSEQLAAARAEVRQAAAQFLLRLLRSGMIALSELERYRDELELPIEPEDLPPGPADLELT